MMRAHSIRWRLALSYAAIACLAALALGVVLLGILRRHYALQERDYLASNAESIGALVSSAFAEDVPINLLQSQLENLAFISKVRIRVLDIQGQELIDTGIPTDPYVMSFLYATSDQAPDDLGSGSILLNPPGEPAAMSGSVHVLGAEGSEWQPVNPAEPTTATSGPSLVDPFVPQASVSGIITGRTATGEQEAGFSGSAPADGQIIMDAVSAFPLSSALFGFAVGSGNASRTIDVDTAPRSDQQITSVLSDANHNRLGGIILSDGPAYGSEIVTSVARGWLMAGGIAVLLAAAAGWFVSRQLSKPLRALTDVTAHMTAGDLSRRAAIARQDEIGTLARSFNVMADRIEETVITLQRFVADAAHELHTPLTALRTNLELVQSEHPSATIRRAHDQVIRLEKLTDSLLTLSRIEAQSDPSPAEWVDLGGLIRSASELYASRAEQSELAFELSLPEHALPVLGRPGQLEVVLSNLVDNAIKFTPAGGTVTLCARTFDQALELIVQDTGIGIPPGDLPLLFERFRRARNASDHPGSGLGLAITKAIVKAHGGSIAAESSGNGTKMTVTLPLARLPQG